MDDAGRRRTTAQHGNGMTRIPFEEAVYTGRPLTKRDLVALRAAQDERGIFSIEGDDISSAEARRAAAVRIAEEVRDKDEKIRTLHREVNAVDAVFDEARQRREELARKIEAQHQEVLEKIVEVRTDVTRESQRRHKELKAFKKKFDEDVENAHKEFIIEVDTRGEECEEQLVKIDERIDTAREELAKERVEREEHIRSGTEKMQASLVELEELLALEQVAREKEEARLLADLNEIFVAAVERIHEESEIVEKRLKRITNEIVKEYKRQHGVQNVHVVEIQEEIVEIEKVIAEETVHREAEAEKLVVNLRDFLDVFRDELEYENAEKRDAIEEMKASMEIKT